MILSLSPLRVPQRNGACKLAKVLHAGQTSRRESARSSESDDLEAARILANGILKDIARLQHIAMKRHDKKSTLLCFAIISLSIICFVIIGEGLQRQKQAPSPPVVNDIPTPPIVEDILAPDFNNFDTEVGTRDY